MQRAGHRYFLDLKGSGFRVVAKLSAWQKLMLPRGLLAQAFLVSG